MNADTRHRTERRWVVDQVVAGLAFGTLLLGIPSVIAWRFGEYGVVLDWPVGVRIALALVKVAPLAYLVYAFVAFYRSRDELERRKVAEAAMASFLIVGCSTFMWWWLVWHALLPPVITVTVPAGEANLLPLLWCVWLWLVHWAASRFVDRRYR